MKMKELALKPIMKIESEFVELALSTVFSKEFSFVFSQKSKDKAAERLRNQLNLICSDFDEKETVRILKESNSFYDAFPDLADVNSRTEAHARFCENFKNGKYPVLRKKMETAAGLFINNILKLAERIESNRSEIEKSLLHGNHFTEITDILFDERTKVYGSCHWTVIIETDMGKIVYKAHDCSLDYSFHQLNERYFSDCFRTPSVVSNGHDYGFCEFIVNKSASTLEETKKYYINLGSMAAVYTFVLGKDCHIDNLLACCEYPVPIDLEMVVAPIPEKTGGVKSDVAAREFSESVASLGILPKMEENKECSPLISTDDKNISAPVIDGIRQTVVPFSELFLKGYEKTFMYCLSIKKELINWCNGLKDVHVRLIMGKKELHAQISDYLNKYQALRSEESYAKAKKNALANLKTFFPEWISKECLEMEGINELPYFYYKFNETSLYGQSGKAEDSYYRTTALETVCRHISDMSEKHLFFNFEIIRHSFSECLIKEQGIKRFIERTLTPEQRLDRIFEKIKDSFIVSPSGNICIVGLKGGDSVCLLDIFASHGMCGIALFLAAYSSLCRDATKKENSQRLCLILLEKIDCQIQSLQGNTEVLENLSLLGEADGISGILKCALLIKKYTNDQAAEHLIKHIIDLINKFDAASIRYSDKFAGLSGLISVFCRFEELPDRKENVTRFADRLLELKNLRYKNVFLWDPILQKKLLSGAGHGMMGIGHALYKAYELTNKQEYKEAAFEAFAFETDIYNEKMQTWPDLRTDNSTNAFMHGFCSGAPGIGNLLVSLKSAEHEIPDYGKNLKRAINCCMTHKKMYRDHLCCGNSSVADFMINLFLTSGNEEYMEKARSLLLSDTEYAYLPETYRNTFSPELFFGASGVGYELLRLIAPEEIESVLI